MGKTSQFDCLATIKLGARPSGGEAGIERGGSCDQKLTVMPMLCWKP